MHLFGSSPKEEQHEDTYLNPTATKRISAPNAHRLTTITETGSGGGSPQLQDDDTLSPPSIPRRSSRRNSGGASHSFNNSKRWSGSTGTTLKSAPPPYDWVAEPTTGMTTTISGPDDDEKLARLRRGEDNESRRRGGWLRLGLIIAVVVLLAIALGVGLGVGLSRKKSSSNDDSSGAGGGAGPGSSPGEEDTPPQKFPVGEYSLVTALKDVQYGCASLQSTWSCWPYTVYSPATTESSLATWNWIIRSTSDNHITKSSPSTSEDGISAGLSISATSDPFGISFTDKPLTYIHPSSNSSAARLTFTFSQRKVVIPSQPITPNNANSKCFFNETTFTGTLYLSADRDYPSQDQQDSSSVGGFQQWPHAVEISQTSNGGDDVPNCYEIVDGQLGQQIFSTSLQPMPEADQCSCEYRNFGL